jgi:hypothetical protein
VTYIIAEAGTSHAHPDPITRYARAMHHVTHAHQAGADAIKFQIFAEGPLFCPLAGDDKRWERWKQTFLTLDEWRQPSPTSSRSTFWHRLSSMRRWSGAG